MLERVSVCDYVRSARDEKRVRGAGASALRWHQRLCDDVASSAAAPVGAATSAAAVGTEDIATAAAEAEDRAGNSAKLDLTQKIEQRND